MKGTTLTPEEIRHIADLAMITLTDEEVAKYQQQLPAILEYVHKVNEIADESKGFTSHVDLSNVLREDEPEETLTQEEATQNRKGTAKNGYITVDSVITSGGDN
ncbi:Asp-tRNA(Asn)/Glu-tRNA(Gln) amidotransferase GatCAB subunit C [Candidatus Dojkabacteria bacterium CG_4_9_14_3_um_filter_150_Dojkabacteria_WS6_41_13]|uniref:Aspartyl/glutamyl-tRNA(Asn/Gln) amidotransferase subunit C n=1 Tax=Candidatus Dojkabacteria bacterium CG_4_10_14_0_2_um_filter_Dojkabacteria_WS6_41_15 TaxID=2014249 RepID=A0A2M7W2F9_9BACT|nr:MAG: Asp-tRNA(Asn)/Glu-tRNA(Gln) amidotransferase GatCAB subunit C [Candidatus Dojkabacteria bacterium CG_4_10_14_3_um_filter_Dojkabacteria_WS6_41_9]PJA14413.1 MAG: Asp-tRNA(Asn)/Glu-tRNA(Gln) amidotransferase GatCAB subunit C [Candidatus Dojkabacteria bacterium CG_4_10_14_0_2_um_filter_Dojkabacteria_WS6_41_15]PJB23235.1 MAG: Asp-tRNA(Asn)/Glu-tRNA(Gln) amidotransferase GatCAB subunit C [Candidatus Dojkabacteria bacterium CG_4_9_14_3_um_filter_150_Dojkabacteria_WS6_41_13]